MKIEDFYFEKYHGLGNDYILVNDIEWNIPEKKKGSLAKKLCEWHFSIGADGLIYVCEANSSIDADIEMRIFNIDGTEAEMCGNGIRCFSKYVYEHGIVSKEDMKIKTLKGIISSKLRLSEKNNGIVEQVKIDMGHPILECNKIPVVPEDNENQCINESIVAINKVFNFSAVSMGNPHCVIFVKKQLDDNNLNKYGSVLENHERFPNKINVEFVKVLSQEECSLRVFERGVGITNSCGTGSCASVVAGVILGKFKKNTPIRVHNDGGDLIITYSGERVFMEGPVEKSFTGSIEKLEF
ncbi:MAG: diaminopimelate epimerase [Promethearchaeota archaeon]|nr:MAG: diaminopimelate epimerase [Candidatus Lokiarchaeota archaeon]